MKIHFILVFLLVSLAFAAGYELAIVSACPLPLTSIDYDAVVLSH